MEDVQLETIYEKGGIAQIFKRMGQNLFYAIVKRAGEILGRTERTPLFPDKTKLSRYLTFKYDI